MTSSNPESPSSAASAVSSSSYARGADNDTGKSNTSPSPVASKNGAGAVGSSADDSAMIITPVKAAPEIHKELSKGKKRQHTQLQLAIVKKNIGENDSKNNSVTARSKHVVLKTLEKKKKSSEVARYAATSVIKWPPVASAKSLPPLAGRIADLFEEKTTGGMRRKDRSTEFTAKGKIEFDVNQECESVEV